ncbi:inositol monophosphatase family protein [Corynebacterium halotolerans]|uniref:inositol monophosphatase family protein n=1 Tax=Corynebacterium halotolerans TaxID=225326 RepID=UPI003CE9DEF9
MDSGELLKVAETVVAEAERMFIGGLGADPFELKAEGDFATEVDLKIETHLRRRLTELTAIPVFGEEAGGQKRQPMVWVVDPIDGTANYAAGNPMCSILVSLLVDGQPVVAVTAIPLLGRRLSAHEGSPLFLNGQPATPLRDRDKRVAQIGFSSVGSPLNSQFPSLVRQGLLSRLAETYLRPRITGSVGVDLAFTAQGIFGGAVSFSPHVWDNAAGVMLVRAAGGVVTDTEGRPWTPESAGVVAGNAQAHADILSTMDEILNQ